MFDNPAAGESAGIMSMIPALLQNKGLDPNMVAALMSNKNNQDAWGGAGCWWIWIILLFFLWGGNGFGNGFGNGANGIPAQLNNEAGRELLMNAIQGNGTAINQLASSLNCSTQQLQNAICQIQGQIQQVGNQVGLSSQQIINSIQSNSAAIGSQLASCCNCFWKKKRLYLLPFPFNVTSPDMMSSHVNCWNSDRRAPVVPKTLIKK